MARLPLAGTKGMTLSQIDSSETDVNDKPRKRSPLLADYPHQVRDIIRFADMDAQGHVNNAKFSTYLETGRVVMFRDPDLSIGVAGATFVLARGEIDYLRELRWPGELVVGSALAHFGRTSFVVAQAVFHNGKCAAAGRFTMVMVDKKTRKATPLAPEVIARLGQWKYRGEA